MYLCFADIDYFKAVNDNYGHEAGDDVLRSVSTILQKHFGASAVSKCDEDAAARWGGEEFAITLSESENVHFSPLERIESIRKEVENTKHTHLDLRVTMSFGLIKIKPNESIEQFIKRADILLYEAKHSGRNCIKCDLR